VVSSAWYSRSSGAIGETASRAWRKSSLSAEAGTCVETIELRGGKGPREAAQEPQLELVHMVPGMQIRAVRLLSLFLAAGLVAAMIAWGCRAIARGVRLRARQLALLLAGP
jgi:hypothetical protein